ncbi:MAG: SIR2 family NAD-dependent protein deacylase [Kurthia gibsonii]
MSANLEALREDYLAGNVVPFIGAGLSAAFNIPTWKNLILHLTEKYLEEGKEYVKEIIENDLKSGDYWLAIDDMKRFLNLSEEDIKEEIAQIIIGKKQDLTDESLHNYSDLKKMNFNLYLTTNYDNLLQQYLGFDMEPILLKDINFNTQNLFEQKRICKLHGSIANPGTIVISKSSYKELYDNDKYNNLLKLITGNKKILFMGFSFDDQFIRTLIQEHKSLFNGNHYILLNNPSQEMEIEMKNDFGLKTIRYKVENSMYAEGIRDILEYISNPLKKKDGDIKQTPILIGAGLKDLQKNFAENKFYKKLQLEEIDEVLVKLSASFYTAAETYIHEMKKYGNSIEVIDVILGQVFMEYQEKYLESYSVHGNSELFLKDVHETLKEIDFGRYKEIIKQNKTNKYENRGFVHVLADSENNEIWWGEKRFGETDV